jgi:excisionase family DNA binding protein
MPEDSPNTASAAGLKPLVLFDPERRARTEVDLEEAMGALVAASNQVAVAIGQLYEMWQAARHNPVQSQASGDPPGRCVTVAEAARILSVAPQTIRDMVGGGQLSYVPVGQGETAYRIEVAELEGYIVEHRRRHRPLVRIPRRGGRPRRRAG